MDDSETGFTDFFGGTGGGAWTDSAYVVHEPITAIRVRAGSYIDSVQARYGETWGPHHGGTGGTLNTAENGGSPLNINRVEGEKNIPSFGISIF